jgi:hypothetical protein
MRKIKIIALVAVIVLLFSGVAMAGFYETLCGPYVAETPPGFVFITYPDEYNDPEFMQTVCLQLWLLRNQDKEVKNITSINGTILLQYTPTE